MLLNDASPAQRNPARTVRVAIGDGAPTSALIAQMDVLGLALESALHKRPADRLAAVIAMRDRKWGKAPCAVVAIMPTEEPDAEELRSFCRESPAHFTLPRRSGIRKLSGTGIRKDRKFVPTETARTRAQAGEAGQ